MSTIREDLTALYTDLDADIRAAAPVCQVSGRCCRFKEYGHTLFLSGPELDKLLDEAPPPVRPLDDGATCPWQDDGGRCTAREARPMACRIYFCDPNYAGVGEAFSEQRIRQLKDLCDRHRVAWSYAPLHEHLRRARAFGRFPA